MSVTDGLVWLANLGLGNMGMNAALGNIRGMSEQDAYERREYEARRHRELQNTAHGARMQQEYADAFYQRACQYAQGQELYRREQEQLQRQFAEGAPTDIQHARVITDVDTAPGEAVSQGGAVVGVAVESARAGESVRVVVSGQALVASRGEARREELDAGCVAYAPTGESVALPVEICEELERRRGAPGLHKSEH